MLKAALVTEIVINAWSVLRHVLGTKLRVTLRFNESFVCHLKSGLVDSVHFIDNLHNLNEVRVADDRVNRTQFNHDQIITCPRQLSHLLNLCQICSQSVQNCVKYEFNASAVILLFEIGVNSAHTSCNIVPLVSSRTPF